MRLQQRIEWISDDSYDTWTVSASQAVSKSRRATSCVEARWTLCAFPLSAGGRNTITKHQKACVHNFVFRILKQIHLQGVWPSIFHSACMLDELRTYPQKRKSNGLVADVCLKKRSIIHDCGAVTSHFESISV